VKTVSLCVFALLTPLTLLAGCNVSTSYATQDLTGNWTMAISDPPAPLPQISSFAGALAGKGQNVTGTLRAVAGTGVSPTFDINFTGSQTADGKLTLTSTNLPNNTVTISGTVSAGYGYNQFMGSLTISGSGACASTNSALLGAELPNIAGTYTGSLSATTGGSVSASATLTESVANADGQFPIGGTITVTGNTCANTFSTTGLVSGASLSGTLTSTSGPSATGSLTATVEHTAPLPLPFNIQIVSAGCNGGTFTGTLTPQ
jgi:hypothetical protein